MLGLRASQRRRYRCVMADHQPPKRRDRAATQARILAAATELFADVGYAQAGIRDIAARADVTSPMLLHYFGSKLGLFETALIQSMQAEDVYPTDRSRFARRLMKLLSDPDIEITPPAMIVLSTGDPEAREVTTRVAREHAVAPLARWLGGPDAEDRATRISILAIAYILFTRQLPIVTPGSDADRSLVAWMIDMIQRIVDEPTG